MDAESWRYPTSLISPARYTRVPIESIGARGSEPAIRLWGMTTLRSTVANPHNVDGTFAIRRKAARKSTRPHPA